MASESSVQTNSPSLDGRATVAVAVQFAINGAFFASVVPRLPELRDRIGISTSRIGLLLTLASLSGLAASATCKRIIARFGTQRVLLGGGILISFGLLLVGVSSNWVLTMFALAAMFAFDVYVDVSMNMQGSWLSARRTKPIMNRLHALWSLGSVAGGLIAARVVAVGISLPLHLTVTAVVLVLSSSVIAMQLLPRDEVHSETAVEAAGHFSSAQSLRTMLFVAGMSAVAIEVAAISWAAFRLTDDIGATSSVGAIAYVAVMGGMTITRFAGDHLAERLGTDRFTTLSAVLAILGLIAAALIDARVITILAFLLAGMGIATLTPRLYDLAAHAGGGTAGGLGVLTAGMRVATVIAPVTIASIASRFRVGTAIGCIAVVAGTAFLAVTRQKAARRPAASEFGQLS